jgi:hypothetical protein
MQAMPPSRPLTDEERMLLELRDTLYEGSWEDFVRDLEARIAGHPYVFEIVPDTPHFTEVIRHHLQLIEALDHWEREHHAVLAADRPPRPADTFGDLD